MNLSERAIKRLKAAERRNRFRARNKGCDAEPVDFIAICEAQGWLCGLCGEPMDPELPVSLPPAASRAVSVGHEPSLGLGGSHTAKGVEGQHMACNIAKGREEDTSAAAKTKRMAGERGSQLHRRASGKTKKIPSRGFATNRDGMFKRKNVGRDCEEEHMEEMLNETDLTDAQWREWWGERSCGAPDRPSPRREELIKRLEAASLVVFGDRRLITLSSTVRRHIAVRVMVHAMSDRKCKLYSASSEFAEVHHCAEMVRRVEECEARARGCGGCICRAAIGLRQPFGFTRGPIAAWFRGARRTQFLEMVFP